jgi:hypothetical protein
MRIVAEETTDPTTVNPCGSYGKGETEDFRVQIVQSSNDVGVIQLVDPQGTVCAVDSQRVSIMIKNFGTSLQTAVPITTTVLQNNTPISTQTIICPDSIPSMASVVYTFQRPFAAVKGSSYTIISYSSLPGDQDTSNDRNTSTIVASTGSATAPSGTAEVCGNSTSLNANTDSNNIASWYINPNDTQPIAVGNHTSTNVIPSNKTYYLGFNDIGTAHVGPIDRTVFPSGGYNEFAGNFVNFYNAVPLLIHSARLYIAHAGKIQFIVADIVNYDPTSGSYSYYELSSNTIDVYPTTPDPGSGAITGVISSDTGAVYYLNLPVPTIGKHSIIIVCQDGANIFRNNNITSNPYPFSIPGVFSITGNSAVDQTNLKDTTFYRKYYYFFYNMSIELQNCPAPTRSSVIASVATPPTITLVGKQLSSSVATGNQWYLNDTAIAGATAKTQELLSPGVYTDTVTDVSGCTLGSNAIVYSPGSGDINLSVTPNPNKGVFNVQFFNNTNSAASINVYSDIGQRVYTQSYPAFNGFFSKQVNLFNVSHGIYFVQILVGSKSYMQRILID